MRKLALSDEILLSVDKAARYIGGEVNSVMKMDEDGNIDPNVKIRVAFDFPDVYEIGMSNLGMMLLYNMFNEREDVWCERVFSPWMDLDKVMREKNIPLFALESQDPIRQFDFLCITLGYEMCYTNVLQTLDLSHIPLLAKDRDDSCPIVVGGGACAYNPEPLAAFLTFFILVKVKRFMMRCLMHIRQIKLQGDPGKTFYFLRHRSPGFMFRHFMM